MNKSYEAVDVRLDLKDRKFKFRVAGIIEHNNKILVVKMGENQFYCFPGGHVELLEDTSSAVKRELDEELYFKVKVNKLLYIHENFFNAENKDFHELCFYYKCEPLDKNLKTDTVLWHELDKGSEVNHKFVWLDKNELVKEGVQPKHLVKLFLEDENKFLHFITKD